LKRERKSERGGVGGKGWRERENDTDGQENERQEDKGEEIRGKTGKRHQYFMRNTRKEGKLE